MGSCDWQMSIYMGIPTTVKRIAFYETQVVCITEQRMGYQCAIINYVDRTNFSGQKSFFLLSFCWVLTLPLFSVQPYGGSKATVHAFTLTPIITGHESGKIALFNVTGKSGEGIETTSERVVMLSLIWIEQGLHELYYCQ